MYSESGLTSQAHGAVLNLRTFQLSYRTGRDDLVRDFFVPCLEASILYRRAAGYFTSAGLALAARGVASLAARQGKMRLVVSPHLEPDDVEALQSAIDRPVETLRAIGARHLAAIEDALVTDRLNALAWLAETATPPIPSATTMSARSNPSPTCSEPSTVSGSATLPMRKARRSVRRCPDRQHRK